MKAMILAAGRGERMGALTDKTPKPLLLVKGKPLIQHHIERLVAAGFAELVINTSYLGEQIKAFVGDGSAFGASIVCTEEPERLETGGGIYNALPFLGDRPFLLVNSDVWSDFDYSTLYGKNVDLAHLVLVSNPDHNPAGDFGFDPVDQCLTSMVPKGDTGEAKGKTYSGISVLDPSLFAQQTAGRFPLAPLLRHGIDAGRVSAEWHRSNWVDVGTPERLVLVERSLSP